MPLLRHLAEVLAHWETLMRKSEPIQPLAEPGGAHHNCVEGLEHRVSGIIKFLCCKAKQQQQQQQPFSEAAAPRASRTGLMRGR